MPLQSGSAPPLDEKHQDEGQAHLLTRGQSTVLAGIKKLICGVGWDSASQDTIDLDASCVLFDGNGQYVDSIYFGNLRNSNGSVVHTGDNRDGHGDGNDEEIVFTLPSIPITVHHMILAINSYSGQTFRAVSSAFVRILDGDARREHELGRYELSASGDYTAMIMSRLTRDKDVPGTWHFVTIGVGTHGRSFGDLIPQMQESLRSIIPNIHIAKESPVIVMTKGESVPIVSKDNRELELDRITLGLGWDPFMMGQPIDLDASCVMFDDKNQNVDVVFFNRLRSTCGSVRHAGDNRTGAGVGDDEKIYVDLSRVPRHIHSLFFIVNSYSGHTFSRIKNAYIRICESHHPWKAPELMRFSLSTSQTVAESTAMIMCKIYRQRDHQGKYHWLCKALGHPAQGRTYRDNIGDMQKELAGRLPMSSSDGFAYVPYVAPFPSSAYPTSFSNNIMIAFVLVLVMFLAYAWIFISPKKGSRHR